MEETLKISEELSQILQSAMIQVRMHRNMLDYWGYGVLADSYANAERNMQRWFDAITQAAFAEEYLIDPFPSEKLKVGQTVEEMLLTDKVVTASMLKRGASVSAKSSHESAPRKAVSEVLSEAREWLRFLDNQLELVRQMGVPSYLMVIARPQYPIDPRQRQSTFPVP